MLHHLPSLAIFELRMSYFELRMDYTCCTSFSRRLVSNPTNFLQLPDWSRVCCGFDGYFGIAISIGGWRFPLSATDRARRQNIPPQIQVTSMLLPYWTWHCYITRIVQQTATMRKDLNMWILRFERTAHSKRSRNSKAKFSDACPTQEAGDSQRTVEQLMVSRGGVVWPQLLPRKTCGDINSRGSASTRTQTAGSQAISGSPHHSCPVLPLVRPDNFSMVEDRLLCRWDSPRMLAFSFWWWYSCSAWPWHRKFTLRLFRLFVFFVNLPFEDFDSPETVASKWIRCVGKVHHARCTNGAWWSPFYFIRSPSPASEDCSKSASLKSLSRLPGWK